MEFQTGTSITSAGAFGSLPAMWISFVDEVIFSIAHMNTSEIIEMPKKLGIKQMSVRKLKEEDFGHCPKFTFSTFTLDPNLQNPYLHKTQIYTNSNLHSSDLHTPKFTQPNIGIPKFTQLKFTQN